MANDTKSGVKLILSNGTVEDRAVKEILSSGIVNDCIVNKIVV